MTAVIVFKTPISKLLATAFMKFFTITQLASLILLDPSTIKPRSRQTSLHTVIGGSVGIVGRGVTVGRTVSSHSHVHGHGQQSHLLPKATSGIRVAASRKDNRRYFVCTLMLKS
jgi:hypothetical protein